MQGLNLTSPKEVKLSLIIVKLMLFSSLVTCALITLGSNFIVSGLFLLANYVIFKQDIDFILK